MSDVSASAPQDIAIVSAADMLGSPVPDIAFYWGDVLRSKGRMTVIGAPKTCKSFLAIELALHIATGKPFLGMETQQGTVLYINLEISEENLQERIQDICAVADIPRPDNALFVSPGGLELESPKGAKKLEAFIDAANEKVGKVDVLIIDPRRQAMGGDENQSEIMTKWTNAIDRLRVKYNFAVVIVHHKGKSTIGAGRGSSIFDAWLDTLMWVESRKKGSFMNPEETYDLTKMKLRITSRDTDQGSIAIAFDYPMWEISADEGTNYLTKVDKAVEHVGDILQEHGQMLQKDLRLKVLRGSHSEYAYKQAIKVLQAEGRIEVNQDTGHQGNWKIVRLVPPPE